MDKVNILLAIAIIFNIVASDAFIAGGGKEVRFEKLSDGSKEYDVTYKLGGKTYHGTTQHISGGLYLIEGENDDLYWVEIGHKERNKDKFRKTIRIAERQPGKISMRDNCHINKLYINRNGVTLEKEDYHTKWDTSNICFSPTVNQDETFDFTISSKSNDRQYEGTTYLQRDPLIQRINITDCHHNDAVYEIDFTEHELESDEPFCRDVTAIVSERKHSYRQRKQKLKLEPRISALLLALLVG